MNKTYRYILYFCIGIGLYFVLKDEESGRSLEKIHEIAPWMIIALVLVMVVMKFIKEKYGKNE